MCPDQVGVLLLRSARSQLALSSRCARSCAFAADGEVESRRHRYSQRLPSPSLSSPRSSLLFLFLFSSPQLANEFRRLEIAPTEIKATREAIEALFRARIRDLKRIFTFYCASGTGAGSAALMSSQEFWKFVKDCKLQKNRKNMPSHRVDLIFQQCTIVYGKNGAPTGERISELGAHLFTEALVRLASWRYNSSGWSLEERVERLLVDDVLQCVAQPSVLLLFRRLLLFLLPLLLSSPLGACTSLSTC